jgi:hypothetical protein
VIGDTHYGRPFRHELEAEQNTLVVEAVHVVVLTGNSSVDKAQSVLAPRRVRAALVLSPWGKVWR